ncbi:hypothetical protein GUJ93_ZPchr0004g40268 [Zizania palustris]|uniref:Uncharacterized protein n=1 Tax=Zizania palustris TaxID=103762 RepID=A0A8J5S2L2_ZIZPA|nr:hypothetical protein GUJ93_ZPchr0004g40268 [Zizania palustris]
MARFLHMYGGAMIEGSWRDLVDEGMVGGEKMNNFNIPTARTYSATLEELKVAMDTDGSFVISRLEWRSCDGVMDDSWGTSLTVDVVPDDGRAVDWARSRDDDGRAVDWARARLRTTCARPSGLSSTRAHVVRGVG